jgi:NADH:ubiquinone oxidoreductase subunit 3 (subunit A)
MGTVSRVAGAFGIVLLIIVFFIGAGIANPTSIGINESAAGMSISALTFVAVASLGVGWLMKDKDTYSRVDYL